MTTQEKTRMAFIIVGSLMMVGGIIILWYNYGFLIVLGLVLFTLGSNLGKSGVGIEEPDASLERSEFIDKHTNGSDSEN